MQIMIIKLSGISFSYHVDKGGGRFGQTLPLEITIDVLASDIQRGVETSIFEYLNRDNKCTLKSAFKTDEVK